MTERGKRYWLYDRFNQFLETYAPHGLYGRALAILITPVIVLQILMAVVILERYWDNVTKVLARSISNEISLLVTLYEKSDRSDIALDEISEMARQNLRMNFDYARNAALPAQSNSPLFSLFDLRISRYLRLGLDRNFWVDSQAANWQVEIKVEVEPGLIFTSRVDADRAYAVGTPLLILFMLLSTLILTSIAVVFLRNQIRPILDLTKAAQDFGQGRDDGNFKPRGATEVRLAGTAFVEMKDRIARHVEQRTAMLAGVSHDLRTILTRFKLGLAIIGENSRTKPLHEDVTEMQQMLEDYMAFVRGDGGEQTSAVNLREIILSVVAAVARDGASITVADVPDIVMPLKLGSFRRLLTNVIANAARHGKNVKISGEVSAKSFELFVDDDGQGIPLAQRADVFRPFVRLDAARNLDTSGSGLGLAIALDIAHAHGGEITLADSPLGGLRVVISMPI